MADERIHVLKLIRAREERGPGPTRKSHVVEALNTTAIRAGRVLSALTASGDLHETKMSNGDNIYQMTNEGYMRLENLESH